MKLAIGLPAWLDRANAEPRQFTDDGAAMRFLAAMAERNVVDHGGPFAAAVTDARGRMIALGVNRVVPAAASMLHAEMLALLLAQRRLGTHDLATAGRFTLYTTCAPCAMCFGALPFSGIARLVCGARSTDATAIGFDEGSKPRAWRQALRTRGIEVVCDVERAAAVALLQRYRNGGGVIY